jgi:hypothetical protein
VLSLANEISVLAHGTAIAEDLPENIEGNPKAGKRIWAVPSTNVMQLAEFRSMVGGQWQPMSDPAASPLSAAAKGTEPAYLSVWDIHSYCGESYTVQGVSFDVHEGDRAPEEITVRGCPTISLR